jgi:hypothetical protein
LRRRERYADPVAARPKSSRARGIARRSQDADSVEYELPAHVHLPSDYVGAVRLAGLTLEQLAEPLVDDALAARLPRMAKHRGHPLAILLQARKA